EVHGQPRLSLLDDIAEAAVGVLAGAEARDLSHGPGAAAIHGRIWSARVRMLAGQSQVVVAGIREVLRGVDALQGQAGQRAVLGARLGLAVEEGAELSRFPGFAERTGTGDLVPVEHLGLLPVEDVAIEIAIVDDPPRLEFSARQRALRTDLDHGMPAQPGAEALPRPDT